MEEILLFNRIVMAERLEDLRKKNGKNYPSLAELSEKIEKNTGVHISHTQLGNYENSDKKLIPSINNILALSQFYGVSVDYLLGRTCSKKNNYTDQMTANKFGLSDKSMNILANIKKNNLFSDNTFKLQLINYIVENEWFLTNLAENLVSYYKASDKLQKHVKDAEKQESIAKYDLVSTIQKFSIESKNNLWKTQKTYSLIDIPANKKSYRKEN